MSSVMISAPHEVTGTAALTGIYKAYEDITGVTLREDAKEAATGELVITGYLAEALGSENATELVNELKGILDQTQNMTDDEVRSEIRRIASDLGIDVTDDQIEQLLKLCRSLEGLDVAELQAKLDSMNGAMDTLAKVKEGFVKFGEGVQNFFQNIGNFFSDLFGGNN